ncbi:alpha/beta hydrolase [Acuticoccus kandeliae]|uniref:alpha/beta hydrolase n=1 Tax=Acuticoccus kandeliae TaxID=2073160 RepID=UPI000D3E9CEE|nr:alpha/beta hydrolase [Acuticoccus kandeliae]
MTYSAIPTPAMEKVLARLAEEDRGVPDPTTLPSAEGRALAARTNRRWNQALPEMAEIIPVEVGGCAATRFVPPVDAGKGAILYIHGGGWAFCSKETHERMVRLLAIAAECPVVSTDYRLAPEDPFPAGLDDCARAWADFRAGEGDRALGISGDSAGANLALALMLREPAVAPAAALLFYGVYGADFGSPSYIAFADGPGLTRAKMQRYFDWYAPGAVREDPLVAPLQASDAALAALPPLHLNLAGLDPLRSDTERLVARLAALGRTDSVAAFEGVVHGFMQMSEALPEARAAIETAGRAFRTIIGSP